MEYFGEPLQKIREQVESQFGFKVQVTRTEVGGFCADCQQGDLAVDPAEESAPSPVPASPA